jgi:hypothetical protein
VCIHARRQRRNSACDSVKKPACDSVKRKEQLAGRLELALSMTAEATAWPQQVVTDQSPGLCSCLLKLRDAHKSGGGRITY